MTGLDAMAFKNCMQKAEYILEELPLIKPPLSDIKHSKFEKSLSHIISIARSVSDKNLHATSGILKDYFENGEPKSKLVLCLLPLDEGYCVNIMDKDENSVEIIEFSYEENELLDYFDNETIPPLLCNTLDNICSDIFISGCVPVEIRDYRVSLNPLFYKSSYIMLKPTALNMQEDINTIAEMTSDMYKWTPDDKLALESTLTLATSAPLCLDPSPAVMVVKNKLQNRNSFKNHSFKRKIKNQSGLALKRQKIYSTRKLPRSLFLNEFLKKRKNKDKKTNDLRLPKNVIDVWRKEELVLAPPSDISDVEKLSKAIQWPDHLSDKDILEVQTIHLESEAQNRDVYSRITIGQRPGDMKYFGTLHSNKYFKHSSEESKALVPQSVFPLGSEHRANLYILQYQELFTEDGRRPAKVSVVKSGQNEEKSFLIPNQQQPWELVQDKSVYSVGSVVDIPINLWTNLKMKRSHNKLEVNSTLHHHPAPVKPTTPKQHPQVTSLGNVRGQIQGQHFVLANVSGSIRQKLLRTKSSGAVEGNNEIMIVNPQPVRLKTVPQQSLKTENAAENVKENTQQQTQPQQTNFKTILTAVSQPQTVIRMPVQARSTNGQITAINLVSTSTGQSLIGSNGAVLGNIQITAGPGGSLTIPASQLSAAGITMQLNTGNKTTGVPQQITLVPTNTLQASSAITLVNNQRTVTTSGQITLGNIRNWQSGVNMQTVNIQQQPQVVHNDNKLQQSVFLSRGGQQHILQRTLSQPQELPRMTYIAPSSTGNQIVLQNTHTTVRPRNSKDQEK